MYDNFSFLELRWEEFSFRTFQCWILMIIGVVTDVDFFYVDKLVKLIPNMHITTTLSKRGMKYIFFLVNLSWIFVSLK